MKNISLLKQASLGVGFAVTILSTSAMAQTPVSTSVQMSGSCSKCDLSHRDMESMSLQGSDFSGSNFSHSNLSGGKFYKSNLAEATFSKAYMMRIEGDGVILHKSNLRDATLSEATLTNSNLSNADLRRADLTDGVFDGSTFQGSVLKAAEAMEASFKGANFHGAYLTHGDFTDADFSHAILTNTVFGDAILDDCNFNDANLSGANLFNVNGLKQEQLDEACGNEKTILPEGLSITSCATDQRRLAVVDAQEAYQNTYTVAPVAPTAPRNGAPVPYYLQSEIRKSVKVETRSEMDLVISEVTEADEGNAMDSPARVRLQNAVDRMEQMRTKDQ